jgi:hypothetical protein
MLIGADKLSEQAAPLFTIDYSSFFLLIYNRKINVLLEFFSFIAFLVLHMINQPTLKSAEHTCLLAWLVDQ